MGKIYDALERHKKEKSTTVKFLSDTVPINSVFEDREIELAKKLCTVQECNPKVVVLSSPNSIGTQHFRMLRTQLMLLGDHGKARTILVTSTIPGEGKTFVAANLAVSIALSIDKHVLLVDCDLRNSQMSHILGYNNSEGLSEYLMGRKPLLELILRPQIHKLSILPAGKSPANPTELLSSSKMANLLQEVRERYQDRFIIIDSPPGYVTAETNLLAKYVDAVVFVIMAGRASRKEIISTLDNLGREKVLGIVFNGHSQTRKRYQKYYEKYYGTK